MNATPKGLVLYRRRRSRVRHKLRQVGRGRPRLSVFRSNRHIYAQVIDDGAGRTLVAASSREPALAGTLGSGGNRDAAAAVGRLVAERAGEAGIAEVVFDRGGYLYHGRIRALAEAAREAGLKF